MSIINSSPSPFGVTYLPTGNRAALNCASLCQPSNTLRELEEQQRKEEELTEFMDVNDSQHDKYKYSVHRGRCARARRKTRSECSNESRAISHLHATNNN